MLSLKEILEKAGVIADELDRGVDFVGDAGRQSAHGFQFLGVAQLYFHLAFFGDVFKADHRAGYSRVFNHRIVE